MQLDDDSSDLPLTDPVDRPTRCRILLAEDNLVNQQVLLMRLRQAGFDVSIAINGREAVEAFDRGGIDMILMDVQMPEIDGLRATRLIRAREKATGGHIPIVAVTANVLESERRRCLAAGMDDYLNKPVRGTILFDTISRLLDRPDLATLPQAGESAHVAAPTEIPDWLRAMRAMKFDEEAIRRLVSTFVTTVPERLDALQRAIDLADMSQVVKLSHTLEGSLVAFAAKQPAELAQRLEQAKLEDAAPLLAKIRERVEAMLEAMRVYLL